MPPALILCPSCACHAKSFETTCPSCGEPLRTREGALPRAAVAVLLGLTTGALSAACSTGPSPTPAYGIAETTSSSSSSGGGAGGASASSSSSGAGGATSSSSSSSGSAAAYGVAVTTSSSSSSGTGGADGG